MPAFVLPDVTDDMSTEELLVVVGKMKKTLDWLLHNLDADNMPGINSVLGDLETGYSSIIQEIDSISLEVGDVIGNVASLTLTASAIQTQVNNQAGQISTLIQTADSIQSQVSLLDNEIGYFYSEIDQMAYEISSIVSFTDVTGNQIASKINQTATTIKLQASKIELTGITTIYSSQNPNTYARLVGDYADFYLYSNGNEIFSIYDTLGGVEMYMMGNRVLALHGTLNVVRPRGEWDFSLTDVIGLEDSGVITAYYPSNAVHLDYSSFYNGLIIRDRDGSTLGIIPFQ